MRLALTTTLALAALGCRDEARRGAGAPAAPAGPGVDAPPARPRLDGAHVTAVRCGLGFGAAYVRRAHVDDRGTIYVLGDDDRPRVVEPGAGPCGLAVTGELAPSPFALAADGAMAPSTAADARCRARRFPAFAWAGLYAAGRAYVAGPDGALEVDELRASPCAPAPFFRRPDDAPPSVIDGAANSEHVLLLDFHGSGRDANAVWRYRADGTFVDKVGPKPGGGTHLGWANQVSTCADGVCAYQSGSLLVFDAGGALVSTTDLHGVATNLEGLDLIEVGGRALYALLRFDLPDGGRGTDLVRLDGVYRP